MVVGLCIGIVIGAVIGFAMRINYFVSPVWIVLVVVLLAIGYIKPRLAFVVIALVVGMIMAFVRVASELVGQDYINQLLGKDVLVIGEVKGDPEYDDGEVKMTHADCPDQICVHSVPISRYGGTIVCLPNRIILSIEGAEDTKDTDTPDAVAR